MIRFVPSLTDEHIQQAVMTARAVVAIDERLARANLEIDGLKAKVAERDGWLKSAHTEHDKTRKRLFDVQHLHSEVQEVSCGDGCCTEGTGVCSYCDEPWPCKTYRVADGKEQP